MARSSVYSPSADRFQAPVDMARCRAEVWERGRGIRVHQCHRKPKVTDADGVGWCTQHSPDAVAKRKAKEDADYLAYRLKSLREGALKGIGLAFMRAMDETEDLGTAAAAAARALARYEAERAELERGGA